MASSKPVRFILVEHQFLSGGGAADEACAEACERSCEAAEAAGTQ